MTWVSGGPFPGWDLRVGLHKYQVSIMWVGACMPGLRLGTVVLQPLLQPPTSGGHGSSQDTIQQAQTSAGAAKARLCTVVA